MLLWPHKRILLAWLLITYFQKTIWFIYSKQTIDSNQDLNNKKSIILDIRKNESTTEYDYFKNKDSKCSLYITKGNYLFGSVKQSKYRWNPFSSDRDIWNTNDKKEYSYLVMVEGVGLSFKKVHIHFVNGTTKSFYKLKKQHYWSSQYWNSGLLPNINNISNLSKHQPTDIKIITEHDSDFINDTTKYLILVENRKDNFRSQHGYINHESYSYLFNDDTKCVELKHKENTVWKYNKNLNRYPQTVSYFPNSNKIIIFFDYLLNLEFKLKNGKWDDTISLFKNIELDIDSLKDGDNDTYKFYMNDSTKTYVYVSRSSLFNKIKKSDKIIFESPEPEQRLHLVIVKDINTNEEKLTTYLANGKVKIFKLDSNYNFKEYDLKQDPDLYFAKQIKFPF